MKAIEQYFSVVLFIMLHKVVFRDFLKLFTEEIFLIKRGRSFHDLGVAISRKDRSPSVVKDLHVGKFKSIPLFDLKLYLPLVSLTDISSEM